MKFNLNKNDVINIMKDGLCDFHQITYNDKTVNVILIEYDMKTDLDNKDLPPTIRSIMDTVAKNPVGFAAVTFKFDLSFMEGETYCIVYEKDLRHKLGVVGHEFGHIFLNHFTKPSKIVNFWIIGDRKEEMDADDFAIEHFGESPNLIDLLDAHIDKCAAVLGYSKFQVNVMKFIMFLSAKWFKRK